MKRYSECEKLAAVSKDSNKIGAFLDWLIEQKKYYMAQTHTHQDECFVDPDTDNDDDAECGYKQDESHPIHLNIELLLSEYFKVDMNKVEKERRQILADLRK